MLRWIFLLVLTPYLVKAKVRKEKNLLGGDQDTQIEEEVGWGILCCSKYDPIPVFSLKMSFFHTGAV